MLIARFATVQGEEEREIRVVGVEQIQGAQIENVVTRNGGEKGIQQVVFFFIKLGVVHAEDFVEIGARPFHLGHVQVVNHDGERELTKVISK